MAVGSIHRLYAVGFRLQKEKLGFEYLAPYLQMSPPVVGFVSVVRVVGLCSVLSPLSSAKYYSCFLFGKVLIYFPFLCTQNVVHAILSVHFLQCMICFIVCICFQIL